MGDAQRLSLLFTYETCKLESIQSAFIVLIYHFLLVLYMCHQQIYVSCNHMCYTGRCFYYFVHSISINDSRINNRNPSLYTAIKFNSTTNYILQNDHEVDSTPPKHYHLHEGRIYCITVALDCISFSQVYLINWQLSVCVQTNIVKCLPREGRRDD